MVQRANIKMPFACWEEIRSAWEEIISPKEEYNLLDDGTIEHTIMYPVGFFDDENNPLEWISARVQISEVDAHNINIGWDSPASVFADNYDTDLIEITFEV